MNETLSERNRQHFAQADGTPFTCPPLSTALSFSGVTPTGSAILTGNYANPTDNNSVHAVLQELQQVCPHLPHHMPLHTMIRGFSKWREGTTTSPSGKHLGIYKSIIQYHQHVKENTQHTPLHVPSDNITDIALQIQNLIINLAIQRTHTLQRWQTVHNFFLEKIPGLPLIEKLRVIHIYEADWNLILKYFLSNQLTRKACQEQTVTPEQAGGRPGRSASDMATKTILTHEICHIQKLTGAVVYNDAKACLDRIIENMSNLACMREGLSPKIAQLHAQTLQQMKYFIKTQHGCSQISNGHMAPDPFHGSGQGAGDSMAVWGFVSDIIIRAYNKLAKTQPMTSPISKKIVNTNIQAFVDDSHGTIIHDTTSATPFHITITHNMQTWESLLHAVGGKLEINKCNLMQFHWTADR
jgi:hypothetical protein